MADTGKIYIENVPLKQKYLYTTKIESHDEWYVEYDNVMNTVTNELLILRKYAKENVVGFFRGDRNAISSFLKQNKKSSEFMFEKSESFSPYDHKKYGGVRLDFYELITPKEGTKKGAESVADICGAKEEFRREIMTRLALAVNTMHGKGIIHANISSNSVALLLNDSHRIYVGGFEYAFNSNNTPSWWMSNATHPPRKEGEEFFSPELAKAVEGTKTQLTYATDVYSLGLLFYLYLTGKMPEKKDDSFCFDDRISKKMSNLLAKMLEEAPEKRYTIQRVIVEMRNMNDSDFALTTESGEDKSEPRYGISVEATPVEEEVDGDIPMAEESMPAKEEESAPPKEAPVEEEKPVKVEEEKPKKEWCGFDEPCPEKNGAWNMREIERRGLEAWKKEKRNQTEGYVLLRKGAPQPLRSAADLIRIGVIVVVTKEDLEKQAWEEPSVKAYCAEKVSNEPTSIELKEKFQTLEKEIASGKAEARRIAGGYYLWIKESIAPEKISSDEMKLLRRCDDLLKECKEEERSPADKTNVAAFMDACEKISGALAKIEQLSFATMPTLSTDKAAAQKIEALLANEDFDEDALDALLEGVDVGEEKLVEIDGDIDAALEIFGTTCAQAEEMASQNSQSKSKGGLDAIFAINVEAMEKDSAWDFIEEIAADAKKLAKAKEVMFSKVDKKAFEESMKLLEKCYAALEEAEEKKDKEIQTAAKKYFDEHADEILEEIKNGNIPVGEELRKEIQRILA